MSVTRVAFIVKLVIVTVVVLGAGDIGDLRDEGIAATLGHSLEALLAVGARPAKKPGTPLKQWTLSAVDYTRVREDELEVWPSKPASGCWIGVHLLHLEMSWSSGAGPSLGQRDCQSIPRRKWQ